MSFPIFSSLRNPCFLALLHIGKARFPNELTGPGSLHEECGVEMLSNAGVPSSLARFALTHSSWASPTTTIEDLSVSVADKIWRGKRQEDLERILINRLSLALSKPEWEVFASMDNILLDLAAAAVHRLVWQASFATD